jgi:hypothetical protein
VQLNEDSSQREKNSISFCDGLYLACKEAPAVKSHLEKKILKALDPFQAAVIRNV